MKWLVGILVAFVVVIAIYPNQVASLLINTGIKLGEVMEDKE